MKDIFFILHCIFILHINVIAHKSFLSDITHGIILTDSHLLLEVQKLVPPKVIPAILADFINLWFDYRNIYALIPPVIAFF